MTAAARILAVAVCTLAGLACGGRGVDRAGGEVRVRVLGGVPGRPMEAPLPLDRATVRLCVADEVVDSASTGGDGRAVLRRPGGGREAVVVAEADGYFSDRLIVSEESDREVEFGLHRSGSHSGRVVSWPDGSGLAGAVVVALVPVEEGIGAGEPPLAQAVSAAGGAFRLDGVPEGGPFLLLASLEGYAGTPTEALTGDPAEEEPPLRLVRLRTLEVLVVRPDGRPAAGSRVRASVTQKPPDVPTALGRLTRRERSASADGEGRAALALLSGWTYHVVAEAAGYPSSEIAEEGQPVSGPVRLVLRTPHRLRVRAVRGASAAADVWMRVDADSLWQARSASPDAEGWATFELLPPGTVTVVVMERFGKLARRSIDLAGDAEVTIDVAR